MIDSNEIYNDVGAIKYLCLMALDYMDSAKPSAEDKTEAAILALEKIKEAALQIEATLDAK